MNPLQKYFRQPKIYISLPSKGLFYSEGSLAGDYGNMPIFGMSGMDELLMKTPDALLSGEATIKLIESCCPYIKNGGEVPSLDIDSILVAIRIATYGDSITVSSTCNSCESENDYDIKLSTILEHYSEKTFNNKIFIDELTINLKPLTYSELSKVNIENFKLQKMLAQINSSEIDDESRQKYIDEIYQKLAEIQIQVMLLSIESIETPEEVVSSKDFIKEWLSNTLSTSYNIIKNKLEQNKEEWSFPKYTIKCSNCNYENKIEFSLDQSNFFVQK